MNSYHTKALVSADIFTIMGSVYAEVSRYDSALDAKQIDLAQQAASRALEIIDFAKQLKQLNKAQKLELLQFYKVFINRVKNYKKSGLDSYLLPFAIAARMRQFK